MIFVIGLMQLLALSPQIDQTPGAGSLTSTERHAALYTGKLTVSKAASKIAGRRPETPEPASVSLPPTIAPVTKSADARRPLEESEVQAAIRTSLGSSNGQVSVRILDVSKGTYPEGQLEFPLNGAAPPPLFKPTSPFFWRGHKISTDGNAIPVWARVQITALRQVIRTKVNLVAGQVLKTGDLEAFTTTVCPLLIALDDSPKNYEGLSLKRTLRAGTQLAPDLVKPPATVERGSIVPVEALIGRADIRFEARADFSGYPGQTIQMTNTSSKRHFRGVIRADGSVEVLSLVARRRPSENR